MINLYTSNNLEFLVSELGKHLFEKKKIDILAPHTIIVQSLGMQRWISLKLALRYGIFTNCEFPFPQQFAENIFKTVVPEYELSPLYDPKNLVWLIMDILPQCIDDQKFSEVKKYILVNGKVDQIRLFQLAQRLALLYDEYVVYFYKVILQWAKQKRSNSWVEYLWKYIVERIRVDATQCHKAQILEKALASINNKKNKDVLRQALWEKLYLNEIFIFGVTMLPEYYVTLFDALSSILPVHIFQLNPSKEYWFDIVSEKTKLRLQQKNIDVEKYKYEVGNPLLASLGKVGKEYIGMLLDFEAVENIDEALYTFTDHGNETLLHILQSDICQCIDRTKDEQKKIPISENDTSITIHSCHSPQREIEVLRDYIIDILNNNKDITPNDIVVMAPDIDVYVPFIHAVFDDTILKKEGLPQLPYSIADQSYRNASRFIAAFCDILEVLSDRLGADEVCALLDYDEVASRFGLDKREVLQFQQWVQELNVRWGKDEEHREQFTHNKSSAFTWQYAIERLLMGYAIPQCVGIVDDIVPFDCVEGSVVVVLENIFNFLDVLFHFYDEAQRPKTLSQWKEFCNQIITAFFDTELHSKDYEVLQRLLSLEPEAFEINLRHTFDFLVIKDWINTYIAEQKVSTNFLAKGITFCQLLPMRSIPFKVICLLGINDGQFPRQDDIVSFDILRNQIKEKQQSSEYSTQYKMDSIKATRCVRSKRADDRYLFLESIISAKKYLFISYQGQSPVDLSIKEPSVVVNELLEYIEKGFYYKDSSQSIKEWIITKHHLHRFHPDYYRGSNKLFSYSPVWLNESKSLVRDRVHYEALTHNPIEDNLVQEVSEVSIDEFINFFMNPARYFIRRILGVWLRDEVIVLEGTEPLVVGGLGKYNLYNELIPALLKNESLDIPVKTLKKEGRIPDDILGDVIFQNTWDELKIFVGMLQQYISKDESIVELRYTSPDKNLTIYGKATLHGSTQVFYRYADVKTKDLLKAFLWHLFVSASGVRTVITYHFGRKDTWQCGLLNDEARRTYIEQFIQWFKDGHRGVLPLFPNILHTYLQECTDLFSVKKKMFSESYIKSKLADALYGGDYENTRVDFDDSYIRRALYKIDFFSDNEEQYYKEFISIAEKMYKMMNGCIAKLKKD